MTRALKVIRAGPQMSVQDMGRAGYLAFGLSRGGAADRLALWEGAALLGQSEGCAALEMAGMGGTFEATEDMRIALTGAPMAAAIDGAPVAWNASHLLARGAQLSIGAARAGSYGYLHVGGGFDTPVLLGARAAHLVARIGGVVHEGEALPVGEDAGTRTGLTLPEDGRFKGGKVRLVPSVQTGLFSPEERARFAQTVFTRDAKGNRMGARFIPEGAGFASAAGLSVLSEVIVPGDVQITGDGTPFVLLSECQTTGGYPRIGAVIPADLPRVAQAAPGAALTFEFVTLEAAREIEWKEAERRAALGKTAEPLLRDPRDIANLGSYQLVSGVTDGAA
ncbi:biotin-dependent carboxyltransferase [Rhodobacteraceae bacterium 63075]|nr:biotin-dependent carboxyltransferase [Rhodobacteraceae bacterium 63075]